MSRGAGALSRQSIGAVVFFGVSCSVLLTPMAVLTAYSVAAKNTHSPEHVAHLIEQLTPAAAKAEPVK